MRRNKKAQIFGEVFIYILAVLITSAILIFGYQAIFGKKGIAKQAQSVEFIRFKTDLTDFVQSMGGEIPGTIRTRDISVPSGYIAACFLSDDKINNRDDSGLKDYPLINGSVRDKIPSNVFLVPDGSVNFQVKPALDIPGGFLCINITDVTIRVRAEALGNKVRISNTPT